MKKWMAVCAALAAQAWTGSLGAHHSISMFDISTAIWVKGTVVSFERVNPHSRITLEEATADGLTAQWTVEGPALFQLDRRGIDPGVNAGDVVEICAFALKEEFSSRQPPLANGRSSPSFVHGHVMVMPDGEKRLWGSYGNLGECIRGTDEQTDSWLDFLNSDPRARDLWCGQRRAARRSALTAYATRFVDEINSLMVHPCE